MSHHFRGGSSNTRSPSSGHESSCGKRDTRRLLQRRRQLRRYHTCTPPYPLHPVEIGWLIVCFFFGCPCIGFADPGSVCQGVWRADGHPSGEGEEDREGEVCRRRLHHHGGGVHLRQPPSHSGSDNINNTPIWLPPFKTALYITERTPNSWNTQHK